MPSSSIPVWCKDSARQNSRVSGFIVGLGLFSVVLFVALWAAVLLLSQKEREAKIAEVMRENANLARAFEEHTVRTLAYVDEILLLEKQRFELLAWDFDLPRFFKDMQINPAIIRHSVITDADGIVRLGSHGAPPVNLADREHVAVHRKEDTDRMFISKPVQARVNQPWSFVATRRANKPDGTLLGVVGVAINPLYFSNFYKELELGKYGAVALIGFDGVVRARLATEGRGMGASVAQSALFRYFPEAAYGSYIAASTIDGVERIYAYRAFRDYPLIVSVGVGRDEALAEVTQRVRRYYVSASLASVLILLATGVLLVLAMRRQRAALALARNEQLLNAIIGHSNTPIAVRNLDTQVMIANAAWTQVWGMPPAGKLIQPPATVESEAPVCGAPDDALPAAAREYEEVITTAEGVRTFLTMQFPLREADGYVFAMGSISTDITQRKQAEDEIRQMNRELQQQATELTAVNRELEAFAYSVSHDLRAPLRAISGYSQLLTEEYSAHIQADGKRYLGIIQSEARRMGVLISEMLKLARVTRTPLAYEPVNLSEIVERQIARCRQREPARTVEADITPDIVVWGDRGLLEIALENLVGNAWKFTAPNPVTHMTFGVETQAGERVCFLRDNGVGFDPVYTDKLFVAFHRLHGAEYEGAGVGLATVSRVIQRHRGRIWAVGKVGQGATFYFVLGG